jgi:hypothetical protein
MINNRIRVKLVALSLSAIESIYFSICMWFHTMENVIIEDAPIVPVINYKTHVQGNFFIASSVKCFVIKL